MVSQSVFSQDAALVGTALGLFFLDTIIMLWVAHRGSNLRIHEVFNALNSGKQNCNGASSYDLESSLLIDDVTIDIPDLYALAMSRLELYTIPAAFFSVVNASGLLITYAGILYFLGAYRDNFWLALVSIPTIGYLYLTLTTLHGVYFLILAQHDALFRALGQSLKTGVDKLRDHMKPDGLISPSVIGRTISSCQECKTLVQSLVAFHRLVQSLKRECEYLSFPLSIKLCAYAGIGTLCFYVGVFESADVPVATQIVCLCGGAVAFICFLCFVALFAVITQSAQAAAGAILEFLYALLAVGQLPPMDASIHVLATLMDTSSVGVSVFGLVVSPAMVTSLGLSLASLLPILGRAIYVKLFALF